jgi:hypothetical protein
VDDSTQKLLQELAVVNPNDKGFSLSQGLIKHKKKIWVGANSALHTKIISAFHSSAMGGPFRYLGGIHATF